MTDLNDINILNNQYTIELNEDIKASIAYSSELKNNNKCIISIGICSKFYFYILGSALFKLLSLIIISEIGLFGFVPILSSYYSILSLYTYFSFIIFGSIIHFCFKRKDYISHNKNALNLLHVKIINQDKKGTNLKFFLACIGFTIYNEIQIFLYSNGYHALDFWTFELVFTFLLMKKYFEVNIYGHHKCSIIFIIIICSILLFIATFLPNDNKENQYQYVEKKLGNYFYSILISIVFMVLSFNYALSINYSKILMQSKFVSQTNI